MVVVASEKVQISIASAEMLLAMKIHASRGRQDFEDLRFLFNEVGIRNYEDAVSHFQHFYQDDALKERAKKILQELLGPPTSRK
jgi:CHAD domain-containing protein